jgi:glutathione synthase/RimK-type ligase-like ATP-grasp enzyme
MSIQRVRSKWTKTEALLIDPALKEYVPSTRDFHRSTVEQMLQQHGMIYVKPVSGTYGNGVIRIEKKAGTARPYFFQSGKRKFSFVSFDEMYRKLLVVKKRKAYLTQQGIHLLKYSGRRFDFRVMVQKNPISQWETTGMIGRLAHPRKIVTNYHAGGTPMPVMKLLKESLSDEQLTSFQTRLRKLGVDVAKTMERQFPRIKEIGVDVAVDHNLKPWILEVNTFPDPYLFKKLPDRAIFRRIYSYGIDYGRFTVYRKTKK